MTAEEFEIAYAKRAGWTLEFLRRYHTVRPCDCGMPECSGWQSISHERAKEYDKAMNAEVKQAHELLAEGGTFYEMAGEAWCDTALDSWRLVPGVGYVKEPASKEGEET